MIERTIAATVHGRYIVAPPVMADSAPILVGFHGYAEAAEHQLERLRAIPGADRWIIVSVQGLNRFYQRRTNEVIAGWMTREHRELAIADNRAYVGSVVAAVRREWPVSGGLVCAGFSQGVAMAFRAAVTADAVEGVIAVGGDVPPEIDDASLARVRAALVCRGVRDEWYTADIFARDVVRLRAANVAATALEFDGGHEWSADVIRAAAAFLNEHR